MKELLLAGIWVSWEIQFDFFLRHLVGVLVTSAEHRWAGLPGLRLAHRSRQRIVQFYPLEPLHLGYHPLAHPLVLVLEELLSLLLILDSGYELVKPQSLGESFGGCVFDLLGFELLS